MKKTKKLSIIIVSYNTSELTTQCIKSVIKFSPKFSYEIIVVDNGSTDDSVSKIREFKTVKVIENKKNLGFSKGNNIGIKSSKGEYVLLLNSDTKLINDVLTPLVEFAQQHQDAGVVAPKLLNKDKTTQASVYRLPTLWRAFKQYFLGSKGLLEKYAIENGSEVEVEVVVGAVFLITPQALKKVGLLNEKYFMYFEDIDYCREVNAVGLKVYYIPTLSLVHIHGASLKQVSNTLLIEASKKYFGTVQYYLYTFVLWSGQKVKKLTSL